MRVNHETFGRGGEYFEAEVPGGELQSSRERPLQFPPRAVRAARASPHDERADARHLRPLRRRDRPLESLRRFASGLVAVPSRLQRLAALSARGARREVVRGEGNRTSGYMRVNSVSLIVPFRTDS